MGRRHFTENGFPKLEAIAEEIRQVVETTDNLKLSFLGVPINFKIKRLLVIGSQVEKLPKDYLRGDHDLDLVVIMSHPLLFGKSRRDAEEANVEYLREVMNESDQGNKKGQKERYLHVLSQGCFLGFRPYFQIYPSLKKFE